MIRQASHTLMIRIYFRKSKGERVTILISVVVIPCGITASMSTKDCSNLMAQCEQLMAELQSAGIRCRGDFMKNYSPGWKFGN